MMRESEIAAHDIADTVSSLLRCVTEEDRLNKTRQLENDILDLVDAIVAEARSSTNPYGETLV